MGVPSLGFEDDAEIAKIEIGRIQLVGAISLLS